MAEDLLWQNKFGPGTHHLSSKDNATTHTSCIHTHSLGGGTRAEEAHGK
jgi:hypothetical protein